MPASPLFSPRIIGNTEIKAKVVRSEKQRVDPIDGHDLLNGIDRTTRLDLRHDQRLLLQDRIFWVWLSKLWPGWQAALLIVKPDTMVRWHRQGFKLYWTWKSGKGRNGGRPKVDKEVRTLIRRMSRGNPIWGVPRIRAELALIGHEVSRSTDLHERLDLYLLRALQALHR
jgi:hypothetical protein